MASGSTKAVLAAIIGNSIVMVAKFVAFAMTGSGAMMSEGIHTAADLLNQILLLIGIRRSGLPADAIHPYGYGPERWIWALMSAVGIFFLGCGVTIYHGITTLLRPHPLGDLRAAVVVLAFSLLIEGYVLWLAARELWRAAAGRPLMAYVQTEADPTSVAIVLEDATACLGVLIAFAAIGLTRWTGSQVWDSIGSIVIGLLLGAVALFLVWRNRRSLVGPAIPERDRKRVRSILEQHPAIAKVVLLRSRVMAPESYRVQAEVEFDGATIARKLRSKLREAHENIEDYAAFEQFAARYAEDVLELLGDEIDAIERQIRDEIPQATHVDIEAD